MLAEWVLGLERAGQRGEPEPADSPESTCGGECGEGETGGISTRGVSLYGERGGRKGIGQGEYTYCLWVPLGSCYPDLGKEQ